MSRHLKNKIQTRGLAAVALTLFCSDSPMAADRLRVVVDLPSSSSSATSFSSYLASNDNRYVR